MNWHLPHVRAHAVRRHPRLADRLGRGRRGIMLAVTSDHENIGQRALREIAEINAEAIAQNACPRCHAAVGVPCDFRTKPGQVHAVRLELAKLPPSG